MTSESSGPAPEPDDEGLVPEDEIEPGDLVIEFIEGVPHVHTEPEH